MITKTLPLHLMPLTALREAERTLERLSSRVSAPCELEALALSRQLLRAEVRERQMRELEMVGMIARYQKGRADRESKDDI